MNTVVDCSSVHTYKIIDFWFIRSIYSNLSKKNSFVIFRYIFHFVINFYCVFNKVKVDRLELILWLINIYEFFVCFSFLSFGMVFILLSPFTWFVFCHEFPLAMNFYNSSNFSYGTLIQWIGWRQIIIETKNNWKYSTQNTIKMEKINIRTKSNLKRSTYFEREKKVFLKIGGESFGRRENVSIAKNSLTVWHRAKGMSEIITSGT